MRKPELAAAIAEKTGLSKEKASEVLNTILDEITLAVKHQNVALVGFGSFETRTRSARTGTHPQTGASIEIPATTSVAFKPGKALKEAVQ